MRHVIYADIIFLMNFCMDFLALFAAGKILGLKLSIGQLSLSSMFGALYCIFTFLYDSEKIIIPEIIINITVSVIMCFIAFNIDSLIKFTKVFLIFYSACFMLGGGIEALYYLSGFIKTENANNIEFGVPSLQVIIISAGICTFIVIFTGSLFKRRSEIKDTKIIIGCMNKEVTVNAIVDSGNFLYDPISSLPVIIVNLKSILNLFDLKTLEFFLYDSISYLGNQEFTDSENIKKLQDLKFRVIPLKTVAGASNILPAFTPDYIKLKYNYKKIKKNTVNNFYDINAVIAVDNRTDEKYNEKYGGIFPATLIES
ncbi:MAG: sigma-E processing peptidase SpoIIGA [Oscillospiraceae bacterium]|nr:sigma-E processing peptidase SpoIIGA [Oscillospiraceae bacterium]